ncbi:MAG: 23S rRNA (pseudouridine(1915)-N(3))-methyltransferase RlmH [Desulfobacteraceae bacterium]
MLKLKIIVVDRTRSSFLKAGESFYLERLRKYVQAEWIEVKPAKIKKGRPEEEILSLEGQGIARRLGPRDYTVPLDRTGHAFDSEELATWLDKLSTGTGGWVSFIIGGPLGLSQELLDQAGRILSLSRLTLTHEMSRLLLLEQLYRAFTIIRGEKYHK